jgi:anti-sigma factor RsiW
MSDTTCGTIRELIPDFIGSRLAEEAVETVERHLAECGECRAELELAQMIFASRARAPEGLLDRVTRVTAESRHAPSRTWWGVSAAAVAALALGIGISSERAEMTVDVPGFAYEAEEGDVWSSDDGLIAGAPLFDGLSDESLLQLLDELSVGSPGGAA